MPVLAQDLKDAVLQSATEGKLTKQLDSDSSIDGLLKSIKQEKERLMKEKIYKKGKVKVNKSFEFIEIPINWRWCLIDDLFNVTKLAGFEYTKYFTKQNINSNYPVKIVRAQNVRKHLYIENDNEAISLELSELLNRSALTKPCLLLTFIGAGIGDVCVYKEKERHHLAPNVAKLEPFDNKYINLEYLEIYLLSKLGQSGIVNIKKSMAQPSLSMETIRGMYIPLPPIEEQARIVAKVDKIMTLIDEYEKLENQLVELKKKFPNDMKAAILQAAMEGDFSHNYEKWISTNMKNVATHQNGKAFKPTDWKPNGSKIIRIQNLSNPLAPCNRCDIEKVEDKFIINKGDILVSWSCTIDSFIYTGERACLNQHIFKVIFNKMNVDKKFYYYLVKYLLVEINSKRHGSTMTHITKTDYEKLNVKIPPIEEQQRIVDKLDQLLPLCDALKGLENDKY